MSVVRIRRGPGSGQDWAERIRNAPLGVLILCSVLSFLGAGFVLGGFYLALARSDTGWVAWTLALVIGPVALYLSLHLLRLTSWAWLAAITLMGLLVASTAMRAMASTDSLHSALIELVLESLCLFYLVRPRIRRAFGWA